MKWPEAPVPSPAADVLDGSGTRRLVAGDLCVELVGMDLRAITWRGVEVVNRLYGALRDDEWTTIPATLLDLGVEEDRDGFVVRFSCNHQSANVPFVWTGTFTGSSSSLTATFDGAARGELTANRIGWCLLHPLSQVGGRLHFSRGHRTQELTLPFFVAPQELSAHGALQPAWGPFDNLLVDACGVRTDISFKGDLFETEDQRNWTDASFKTYSTPLSESRPFALSAGDRVRQVLRFSFASGEPASGPREAAPPRQRPTPVTAVVNDPALPARDVEAVLAVVDGLRAEVSAGTPAEIAAAIDIVALARRAPRWELTILASDETAWDALDRLVAEGSRPASILVLPLSARSGDHDECTTSALLAQAHAGLPTADPATIGGGTRHDFCGLNRHELTHLPVVSCTFSPRVHAEDERSIRETPTSYPAVVASARQIAPRADFVVGPLRDPYGLPPGWVADSIRTWIAAGADSICIAETSALARAGRLTDIGESISALRSETAGVRVRIDSP